MLLPRSHRRVASGGGSNGLLTGLVSYWDLDEASGTRVDSHGSNDLTDNNTVGSAPGIINNAALFNSASSEYLSTASVPVTSFPFSFSFWVKLTSTGSEMGIMGFANSTVDNRYISIQTPPTRGYELQVRDSGASFDSNNFSAANGGSLSTNWVHIVAVLSANNSFAIFLNNSLLETDTNTTNFPSGINIFSLGAVRDSSSFYSSCAMEQCGIWSRVLDATDISNLYNSGSGLAYSNFD